MHSHIDFTNTVTRLLYHYASYCAYLLEYVSIHTLI